MSNSSDKNKKERLSDQLKNPSRPVFLLGEVPPREGTGPGECQRICNKFMARSRALASDGFIVYDIQDEPGRVPGAKRPFPFRRVMDSSDYAALLSRSSGKECLVYKCIADDSFESWVNRCSNENGHSAINLVGRASSQGTYSGPSMSQAMDHLRQNNQLDFGCVCIAERHTMEAAQKRGKDYPTEHLNMLRKQESGCGWFVSQAIYDVENTIRLIRDYAAICRQKGLKPRKMVLTFAPVSRAKTMEFVKWLGVQVPTAAEELILKADKPVDASIDFLCNALHTILSETVGAGVPLGISCESVSIYKAEIDGVHELFKRLQGILLDSRNSPWKVQWIEVISPANTNNDDKSITQFNNEDHKQTSSSELNPFYLLASGLFGAALGGTLVAVGVITGALAKQRK